MSTTTKKPTKKDKGFSAEEKAAMKERAREMKAEAEKADGEKAVLEKINEMQEPERGMAMRLHEIIKTHAPVLTAKTWYGMPAYYKDGKNICFFQSATKFGSRYATLGFSDSAKLDDGSLFPVAYALMELTDKEEKKVIELIKKAVG